jgi:hypothetical protein
MSTPSATLPPYQAPPQTVDRHVDPPEFWRGNARVRAQTVAARGCGGLFTSPRIWQRTAQDAARRRHRGAGILTRLTNLLERLGVGASAMTPGPSRRPLG